MKRIGIYILLCLLSLAASADTVKQLQQKQKQLQQEIEQTNKMLQQTKKDETSTLNKLQLLSKNISTQKQLIRTLGSEITALDDEMQLLGLQRDSLQG